MTVRTGYVGMALGVGLGLVRDDIWRRRIHEADVRKRRRHEVATKTGRCENRERV